MGSFRSALGAALLGGLLTVPAFAADVRVMKDPTQLPKAFPAAAKLRVLNVWATWCMPCVAEMPDLRAMDELFGTEVSFAGVTLDNMLPDSSQQKVVSFLDKQKIAFPNIYFTGKPDDLGEYLKFSGEIPVTIVYDAKGKEVWRHEGRLDRQKTIAHLRELLRRIR